MGLSSQGEANFEDPPFRPRSSPFVSRAGETFSLQFLSLVVSVGGVKPFLMTWPFCFGSGCCPRVIASSAVAGAAPVISDPPLHSGKSLVACRCSGTRCMSSLRSFIALLSFPYLAPPHLAVAPPLRSITEGVNGTGGCAKLLRTCRWPRFALGWRESAAFRRRARQGFAGRLLALLSSLGRVKDHH